MIRYSNRSNNTKNLTIHYLMTMLIHINGGCAFISKKKVSQAGAQQNRPAYI